ncbi:MAG TPA: AraC family transcriptional regulator [Vicinamibacterales bacterium]
MPEPFHLPNAFTPGRIVRWRRAGGLALAEAEFDAGQRIERDIHGHARFVLVLRGTLTEVANERTRTYRSSALLFRRANEAAAYVAGEAGATCLIVDMDDLWFRRAREQAPLLTRSSAFHGGLVVHLAHRLYGEFRLRDEVSRLAIESITLGVLAEASRRAARAPDRLGVVPPWLIRARLFVDAHFAERLAIATVATLVGVHPVHLARTFRRVYHTTFAGYVRDLRIEFARRELALSGAALSDIAAAAGFCDQSHFSRLFKRYTGMSPAEYRLAVRPG